MITLKGLRILIIDKHDEFRQSLRNYLYSVVMDPNIQESKTSVGGIHRALQNTPDLALMDLDTGGLYVSARLRQMNLGCKNIILLNETRAVPLSTSRRAGVHQYLDKNMIVQELVPLLNGLFARKHF